MNHLLPLSASQQRVIKISIIGRHHTLLVGPKGVGKSEALAWFRVLTPDSDPQETWERLLRHESRDEAFQWGPPLRQVGADVKPAHLLGSWGTSGFRAGELALAHGGVLFADEFMEWARDSKECLREPLQTKRVRLTRTRGTLESACDLQLVATGNLCPCGGLPRVFRVASDMKSTSCQCSETKVRDYLSKLSGPILDRLDLVILMTSPRDLKTHSDPCVETLRREIAKARAFAIEIFGTLPSRLPPTWLEASIAHQPKVLALLESLPSLRSRHKTLRVAKSIQALEASEVLKDEHVFEAKTYRLFDSLA